MAMGPDARAEDHPSKGVFVVGSSGYLGSYLVEGLLRRDVDVSGLSRGPSGHAHFDLMHPRDFDYSLLEEGSVVTFGAGIASPDACDADPSHAWRVNVTCTSEAILRFLDAGAFVVFLSSDVVFGATEEPAFEDSPHNPHGHYAESKAEVERRFEGTESFLPIRLSYVFSRHDAFTRYLIGQMEHDRTAEVFDTLYRNVLYCGDLLEAVDRLARSAGRESWPLSLNVGGPDLLSRMDMARIIGQAFPSLRVETAAPPAGFLDSRPAKIWMESRILPELLTRQPTTLGAAVLEELVKGGVGAPTDGNFAEVPQRRDSGVPE